MVAGGVLAILAGVLSLLALRAALSTVQVAPPEAPLTRPVVVAVRLVPRRSVLTQADVETRELPEDSIRSGAVVKVEDAVGKITLTELTEGQIVLAQNLLDVGAEGGPQEAEVSLAEALEEGEVAVALPVTDIMTKYGVVQPGDKVDVLFTANVVGKTYQEDVPRGGLVALMAVQNLEVLHIVTETPPAQEGEEAQAKPVPQLVVLIATPQDAVILKYLKDSGSVIDFALRSPTSEQLFQTEAVTINYLAEKYGIVPPEPLD
jgi:pilus assembly protein CpaB